MSTEDGSNKNNIDGNGTDKNSIDKEKTQEFLHKNGRYLIMAGMFSRDLDRYRYVSQ